MPSVNEKQRKFFAIAKSIKEGETPSSYSPQAARVAGSMSEKELRKFAVKSETLKRKAK